MISISNVTRKLDSFDNSNQIHLKNWNIRKLAKFFIAKQEKKRSTTRSCDWQKYVVHTFNSTNLLKI